MKTCINCKIEYTPRLNNKDFCNYVYEKAYKQKWLYKLYRKNNEFLTNLIEKNLRVNY